MKILLYLVVFFVSSNTFASLIGDTIVAEVIRDPGVNEQVVINNETAVVGAGIEFSAQNFLGSGSTFDIDVDDGVFSIFVDFADLNFLQPYAVSLTDLDWLGEPGQITGVTHESGTTGWLDDITFGSDFIMLQSSPNLFLSAVTATATYSFTADHGNISVPEPSSIMLLGIGLLGLTISRRRKVV